jgi:hypothetical protein
VRSPYFRHDAACFAVVWAELEDRLEDAWALSERALVLGSRAPAIWPEAIYAAHQFGLWHREGRLGEHVDAARTAVEQRPHMVVNRALLTLALFDAGRVEQARTEFEGCADGGVPRDGFWFTVMAALSECAARLGDARRATALYEALVPFRARFVQAVSAVCWGSAEFYLGLLAQTLGDAAAAREHHERGIARNEAAGLRFRAARGRAAQLGGS